MYSSLLPFTSTTNRQVVRFLAKIFGKHPHKIIYFRFASAHLAEVLLGLLALLAKLMLGLVGLAAHLVARLGRALLQVCTITISWASAGTWEALWLGPHTSNKKCEADS